PRALDAHDGHAVLVAHTRFAEREALDLPRRTHLHHGEVTLIELDVLHHPGTDQVGHAPTRIRFGVEDVVGADAVEDLAVRGRDRLRPHLAHTEVDEIGRGEHAVLDRRADADDGGREITGTD